MTAETAIDALNAAIERALAGMSDTDHAAFQARCHAATLAALARTADKRGKIMIIPYFHVLGVTDTASRLLRRLAEITDSRRADPAEIAAAAAAAARVIRHAADGASLWTHAEETTLMTSDAIYATAAAAAMSVTARALTGAARAIAEITDDYMTPLTEHPEDADFALRSAVSAIADAVAGAARAIAEASDRLTAMAAGADPAESDELPSASSPPRSPAPAPLS